ncbi:MAG: hypothetical protein ACKO7B_04480, partial [Flavobacteriales bacterium]
MTRDVTYESKAIPTIEAEIEWSAPSAVRGDDNKLVVFSAAQSDELATARADAEGRMTSVFTQSLVSALKKAKGNESLDQMLNVCQQYMDDLKVVQHPVLDANATRRKRSLSGVELNQAGLVVQQLLAGKRATVYGADVLNMSVGSSVCDLAGTACAKVLRIVNPTEAEVQFSSTVKSLPPFGTPMRIASLASDEAMLKVYFSKSVVDGRTQEFTSVMREFEQKLQAYANANKAELSLTDSARADYLIRLVSGSQTSSWVLERIHGTGEGIDAYPTEQRRVVCDVHSADRAWRYMEAVIHDMARYLSLLHMRGSGDFGGELVVHCNGVPLTGNEVEVHLSNYIQIGLRRK